MSTQKSRLTNTITTLTTHSFSDRSKLLEIQPHNSVSKKPSILLSVPLRHINNVRLQNNGPDLTTLTFKAMNGRDRAIVPKPMLTTNDSKPGDVAFIIENIKPLGAGGGGEAGDDVDLPGGPHGHVEVVGDVAAFDEVLVGLWAVEAADDGPDGGERGVDALGEEGGALGGAHKVGVVEDDGGLERVELFWGEVGGEGEVVLC